MKATSIEWLMNELEYNDMPSWMQELFDQAKEKHKQEIIRAHVLGIGIEGSISPVQTAHEYYDKTFNK